VSPSQLHRSGNFVVVLDTQNADKYARRPLGAVSATNQVVTADYTDFTEENTRPNEIGAFLEGDRQVSYPRHPRNLRLVFLRIGKLSKSFFPSANAPNTEKSTAIQSRRKNAFHPAIPEVPTVSRPHDKPLVFSIQIVFANSRNTRIYGKNGNNAFPRRVP
jgi:hypothetical protein